MTDRQKQLLEELAKEFHNGGPPNASAGFKQKFREFFEFKE